jgi:hypothetical protein
VLARSQRRAGTAALTLLAFGFGSLWAWTAPASAADATTTTAKCPTPEILGGVRATGATVTTPGAKVRKLDKDQATAFMQTWLAYSVFQNPPQEHPPAGVPVSRVNVTLTENGQPGALLIFYATDGTKVWVGAPAPVPAPPPNDQRWIRAPRPEQTTSAFKGEMAPICTGPTTSSTTSTTTATSATTVGQAAKPDGTSSDSDVPWVLIVVGIVVVVGGATAVAVRARRTTRVKNG